MIKVMLVEDQLLLIEGLRAIVATVDDIEIIGVAANGVEAMEQLDTLKPDVVVMDIHMPKVDGIKAAVYMKKYHPTMKIVFLTTFADEDLVVTGFNAGADGFLLKTIDATVFLQSIRNVYHDQIVITGEAARILAEKIRDMKYDKQAVLERKLKVRHILLSARELEIAYLLMQNKTNRHMANHLHLSEGTVKNYISDIYNKLNLRHRNDVIAYLNGLFET